MKKIIFLFAFTLIANNFYANNLDNEKIKIKDFNFISEVDYEKQFEMFFDENSQKTIYLIPMKNSTDLLVAYQGLNNELVPLNFMEISDGDYKLKDINNRKDVLVLELNQSGKFFEKEYIESNDSKIGLAMKGCLGQTSTLACTRVAINACSADTECSLMCRLAGFQCLAAITAACAVSCNTSQSVN